MKVLMIAPACDGEDVGEAWVAAQWATLIAERHELTLLTTYKRGHTPMSRQLPGARVIEWQEPAGVGRFERFNSLLQPGYLPFFIRARRWIRRHRAEERFDVAHQPVPVAMRYPSPATGSGIPLIIGPVGGSLDSPPAFAEEEGATPWWQRLRRLDSWRIEHDRLLRATYESAALVLGVAEYVPEFVSGLRVRRFEIMSETAVHDIPAPVDRAGRSGPVRLLYVGRIVRTKGLRDVIRALAELRDVEVRLDVVGDGNDRAACERLAAEVGVADRVAFHGKLPRAAVDDYYREADVFVFPSYREPGGNVALEAMSFGLPVIVCRRGGPGANVTDACAVRLEATSPAQLAADCATALRRLVGDPELRLRMGSAGREHVASTHLWSQRAARMTAYYREVAAAGA
ncbi:glycosyltransferase family 4 protein [Cumulibacter manganitolerans]|uniref:glycosyltransferase family 4 protein n=1 Tax=Cumulibacter manganitolerans TaxID=1884992 RepID=UPI001E5285AE|nr:glycosyltransferase family 4 protein [Cumulibacter manganitolerans]